MTTARQRWVRRVVRGSGWVAGIAVIALALLMALAHLLLPLVAGHPQWVAAELSARLERPTSFTSMEGRWTRAGPLLVLRGVTVAPATGSGVPMHLPEVELGLDFGGWLRPSRHLLSARVRGLALDVRRAADGRWSVNGIPLEASRGAVDLGHLSLDLWLEDARLTLTDAGSGHAYRLRVPQLRISRSRRGRVRLGGVLQREGATGSLRIAVDARNDGARGRAWAELDAANLVPLLRDVPLAAYRVEQGSGRVAVWLDWRDGKLEAVRARLDIEDLQLAHAGHAARVATVQGVAGVYREGAGFRAGWASRDGSALVATVHAADTPAWTASVAARDFALAPWLAFLALDPGIDPALAAWLGSGGVSGVVTHAQARFGRKAGLQAVNLDFARLAVQPSGRLPGASALRGSLRGDAEALALTLPRQAATFTLPHLFRQPIVLTGLSGTLALWKQDGDWTLGMDELDVAGAEFDAELRGELAFPAQGGAPRISLFAHVGHASVQSAKLFWPLGEIPPNAIAWLDRALVAGDVEGADVVLHGDMADWPFRAHEGRFEARAPIRGLTLDYAPGWPRADGIDATADFVNSGMRVVASRGQSLGMRADATLAQIQDFGSSPLELTVRGSGDAANALRFVRESPIGRDERDTLDKLAVRGKAAFAMQLTLPLGDDGTASLSGGGELSAVGVDAPDWNLHLAQIAGPVRFDIRGFEAGPLQTEFHGGPATLALTIGDVAAHPDAVVWAQLEGDYALADLLTDYPNLGWIGRAATGSSAFRIGYTAGHAPADGGAARQRVVVDSDLRGIALGLPAPLDKAAAASWPLHVTVGVPVDGNELQLALGHVARARFRLADATHPLAGTLALGQQMPQAVPAQGLDIRGHAGRLDVTGWIARVAGDDGEGGMPLAGVGVDADQALWFGRSLGAMRIDASERANTLEATVEGPALAGTIAVPTTQLNRLGVTARIQRLYWPGAESGAMGTAAPGAAAGAGGSAADAAKAAVAAEENPADTGVNPAALPPFHLWVKDLRLGVARLGEARLESWPTAQGMHIEQLRALSGDVQITASGDWNGTASNSHSRMRVNFSANDLGDMLGAFGFAGLVHGGRTHDELDATWPGAPSSFSLANMDGTLSVDVRDGRIPEAASPGVGRLLGLVSLAELPRRLTLDFGDVFGKGMAFDSIVGNFRLGDGNAVTKDLAIAGPAANITISGRTGLRARDYDQDVHVVPHVGNSLPLVGAVVGGPVGAAAGLAVQGLLGHGLNMAASARYRITGSWDKPVLTLVEKQGGRAPETEAPLRNGVAPAPATSSASPAHAGSVR